MLVDLVTCLENTSFYQPRN